MSWLVTVTAIWNSVGLVPAVKSVRSNVMSVDGSTVAAAAGVGAEVGDCVGDAVGAFVGDGVGVLVGDGVGDCVGAAVGGMVTATGAFVEAAAARVGVAGGLALLFAEQAMARAKEGTAQRISTRGIVGYLLR